MPGRNPEAYHGAVKRLLLLLSALATLATAEPPAIARLESTPDNRAHGTVWFVPARDGKLRVMVRVIGLPLNGSHSLHIHQLLKYPAVDLGLLEPDELGVATMDVRVDVKLSDLLGRPVILHAANSEISANMAVGKVEEADARAMREMREQPAFGGTKKP